MAKKLIDMVGVRVRTFTVIGLTKTDKKGTYWDCLCDCGTLRSAKGTVLRANKLKCKCQEVVNHPLYDTWSNIKYRCRLTTHPRYKSYGGRGIKLDPRWNSFLNFISDMGPRPEGTTVDRIDNDGNYEPGNCKWSTVTEQNRNTRASRMITAFGKTQNAVVWAAEYGLSRVTLGARLKTLDPEVALVKTTPRIRAARQACDLCDGALV